MSGKCMIILPPYFIFMAFWSPAEYYDVQRGSKVTSLVAHSSRGSCAQHLRWIRGCDARIRRESGAYVMSRKILRAQFAYDVRHVARVHHANVARTCRVSSAQQGMLLLDPSVMSLCVV
jgi:hypothetical protein